MGVWRFALKIVKKISCRLKGGMTPTFTIYRLIFLFKINFLIILLISIFKFYRLIKIIFVNDNIKI